MSEDVQVLIRAARAVTVLTGAGISTESGIPDFRGPNGVWTRDPEAEKLSDIRSYTASREIRVKAWKARAAHPAFTAQPNAGHRALADLERDGRLHTLITQNVDGLHQKAGTSDDKIVEIHGTVRDVECLSCGDRNPMETALARLRAGEDDPECRRCGGILKSATISFGQALREDELIRAERAARECDLFLAVGTSLTVYPVAALPDVAVMRGVPLIIVNAQPTPYDPAAVAVIRDPIGTILPSLIGGVPSESQAKGTT